MIHPQPTSAVYTTSMSNIVVLAGGNSNERNVSLRSGAAVAHALNSIGHHVTTIDPRDGLTLPVQTDVVFPALHGLGGEDGTVQAALETASVPYVGSGPAASALCFDKWLYRRVLTVAGLPVADGAVVTLESIWESPLSRQPFALKPIQGGSTIDTFIVRDLVNVDKKPLETVLRKYGVMLLEALISGTELTIGILDTTPLPVVEIIPPTGSEFDYDNKYNGKTQELCPPQHVSAEIQKHAQALALKAHKLASCRHLSRTDIMVDEPGELYVLETNTLPGMTDQSLFPKAAAAAGINFPDLCDKLVKLALAK